MTSKHKHIPEEAMREPRNPTSMLNITDTQCKYPLDNEQDVADSNTLFCGRKQLVYNNKHYSYCEEHIKLVIKQRY